jgi:hydrogenase nickel incorporation protein HypA/HybF
MHELSIADAIVRTVVRAVGETEVEAVEVVVGAMSGVVADALAFAWDVVTAGTPMAGARLTVTTVPVTVFCDHCDAVVTPTIGVACPWCERPSADLRSGRELQVVSALLKEPAANGVTP